MNIDDGTGGLLCDVCKTAPAVSVFRAAGGAMHLCQTCFIDIPNNPPHLPRDERKEYERLKEKYQDDLKEYERLRGIYQDDRQEYERLREKFSDN